MTQEQREALIDVCCTVAEKVAECVAELADRIYKVLPVIADAMIEDAEKTGNEKKRRQWKLVKDTLPHYTSAVRCVLPRARSCC
jgi:hypothetical protein